MSNYFENVSNGQEWRPEPFRRYNAVNALLSEFGPTGAGRGNRATENRTVYSAINRGTETIHAGTAVEPSGGDLENDQLVPVKQSAAKTTALWGVSLSDLEPGDIGQVLLTGITTIPLAVALPADTAYVAPGTDGKFEATTGSRAQVIATKDLTAIVVIGAGGGSVIYDKGTVTGSYEADYKKGDIHTVVAAGDLLILARPVDIPLGCALLMRLDNRAGAEIRWMTHEFIESTENQVFLITFANLTGTVQLYAKNLEV